MLPSTLSLLFFKKKKFLGVVVLVLYLAMAKHQIPGMAIVAACFVVVVVLLSSLACEARHVRSRFVVQGRVFCDTCRAGFETPATTYLAGK